MGIPLRIAGFTGQFRRSLRRFTFSSDRQCPVRPDGYNRGHDASVVIDTIHGDLEAMAVSKDWPHDDPRWPIVCAACGYVFAEDDRWQRNDCRIYRLPDGTEFIMWGMPDAPPGTMIRVEWADEHFGGESWQVWLPDGGTWISTQTASGGGKWDVTGTPPQIDVHPSIWHNQPNGWHGFIRNGELVDA